MNLIDINKPTITKQVEILTNDLKVISGFLVQVMTAIIHLEGYDNIETDLNEIEKTIKDNQILNIDIENLPDCLKIYTKEQLILYSMSYLRKVLSGEMNNKIIESSKFN